MRVGGDKMDEAIMTHVKRKYNMLIGEASAEEIKIKIASAYPMDPEQQIEVKGRDLVTGIPQNIIITSEEVRKAISEQVESIVQAVRIALEQTPPELAADIVDRGIVLTGGGALLKGLDQLLREQTSLPITVVDDPLSTVVMGTGRPWTTSTCSKTSASTNLCKCRTARRLFRHGRPFFPAALTGATVTFRRFLLMAGGLLVLFLGMYSWNQRTHTLDDIAANVGLEMSGTVLGTFDSVKGSVMDAWRRYVDLVGVREENERLRAQVAELQARIVSHGEDLAELARLRELVQLPVDSAWKPVGARILAGRMGPNAIQDSITINRGYTSGPPRHPHRHQHGPCGPRAAGQPPCRHGPAHHRPGQPHRRVRPAEPLGRHPERTGPGAAAGSGLCGTRRPGDRRGDPHHLRSGRQISQGHPRAPPWRAWPPRTPPSSWPSRPGPWWTCAVWKRCCCWSPAASTGPLRPSEPAPTSWARPGPPKRER